MGRGIIESGLFRSERYQLERRTSDPSTTQEGEMWIRTDLAPDADQLATLRFDAGGATWDIPIFDDDATTENVEKAWRVRVGGATGFVPISDFAAHPELKYQHNGAAFGVHDALTASAIPDSEANQKLLHRWYLSESSPPFADAIGGADSTSVTGTTQVTGDWIDDAARQGDGTADRIETTTLGDFGSNADTDFALAYSIDPSGGEVVLSSRAGGAQHGLIAGYNNSFWNLSQGVLFGLRVQDGREDAVIKTNDNAVGSGRSRVVINKVTQDPSNWEIWINQTQVTSSVQQTADLSNPTNLTDPLTFFSNPTGNSYYSGVIDDVCVFGDSLTQSEIESYQNPWS